MRMKPQQGRRGVKQKNTVTAFDRCQASCAPAWDDLYKLSQHRLLQSGLYKNQFKMNRSQAADPRAIDSHYSSSGPANELLYNHFTTKTHNTYNTCRSQRT